MFDTLLTVPVQYVLFSEVTALIRPYHDVGALREAHALWLDIEPLPEPNHWRLVLEAELKSTTAAGEVARTARCAIEAIVVAKGLPVGDEMAAIGSTAAAAVLGSVRSLLSNLTQPTGLGTFNLPPYSAEQVQALPSAKGLDTVNVPTYSAAQLLALPSTQKN